MSKLGSAGLLALALFGLTVTGCGGGGGGGGGSAYEISGSVKSATGTGVPGTSVLLSGADSKTAVTDAGGNYSFKGLKNGTYTVTPVPKGLSCTPRGAMRTMQGANITDVSFTAKASSPIVYVTDTQRKLATVDITNGNVLVIGDTGVVMTDIAFDSNGNLYGISTDRLYRINRSNAAATVIGNLNIPDGTSLEFSSCGDTLYTANNYLRTVDIATGTTTTVGKGFTEYPSSGDLAFVGGTLYLASRVDADVDKSKLLRVDTSTGAGTPVSLKEIGFPTVFGLVSNDNEHLYGFSGTNMIEIDKDTGEGELYLNLAGKGLGNINGGAYYYFEPL